MSLLRRLIVSQPMSVGAGPAYDAFRKSHEIDGSAGGAQTDYQIMIKVLYQEGITDVSRDLANNPLAIPNYGASGATHPNVMYFPDGEDGYDYWMLYTPYPPSSEEEPSIVRCNDGITFVDTGITNPVVVATETWEDHHLADPEWIKVGATWSMYYAASEDTIATPPGRGHKVHLAYVDSVDGKTWGNKTKVLDYDDMVAALGRADIQPYLSPAAVKVGDTYYVFFSVTMDTDDDDEGEHSEKYYASGPSPTNLTINSTPIYASAPGDWSYPYNQHIGIFEKDGTYYLILQGSTVWSADYTKFGMIKCTSFPDTWVECNGNPFMSYNDADAETWEARGMYKPDPVMIGETLKLYYSAKEADNDHHIGVATLLLGDLEETVSLDGKCRTDFGDIRFRQGETELDYWLEEKVDEDYAIFRVKLLTIPADPDSATIYIYYGKADATTESDFDATFPILADDFEDGVVGNVPVGWNESGDAGDSFRVADDEAYQGTKSAKLVEDGGAGNSLGKTDDLNGYANLVIHLMFRFETAGRNSSALRAYSEGDAIVSIVSCRDDANNDWRYRHDSIYSDIPNWSAPAVGVWYRLEAYLRAADEKAKFVKDRTEDSGWLDTVAAWAAIDYLACQGVRTTPTSLWYDDVYMRKYVEPEPTHSTWGAEEAVVWPF